MADDKLRNCDCRHHTECFATDKIYINWKEPNRNFSASSQSLSSRFQPSHRETWNVNGNGNGAYLLYSPNTKHSSLARSCSSHKSSSLGRPNPCHAPSTYYNTENRTSRYLPDNLGQTQEKEIYFVNNLFDDDASGFHEGCVNQDPSYMQTDDMYSRMSRDDPGASQNVFPVTLRRCPRPCNPREDTENYYEVVEAPPPKLKRPVHSQYISLEKAMSIDGKPQIPPRNKLHPDFRDSIRLNMSLHEMECPGKGYDRKVCLPDHMEADFAAPRSHCCAQKQEIGGNIFRNKSDSKTKRMPEIFIGRCRHCRDCSHDYQRDLQRKSASLVRCGRTTGFRNGNVEDLEWDYFDIGGCNRRKLREHHQISRGAFHSYLGESDRESILTSFSSTEALAQSVTSVDTPAWFDELISSTFPSRDDCRLRRRSASLSSLPYASHRLSAATGASLHLDNNIHRDRKVFMKTRVYSKIKSQLKRDGHLLITGYPGIGKTALAYQILRDFASDGTKPFVIDTPSAFPERIPGGNAILLVDDIFGSIRFEEGNIDAWKKVLKKLDEIWDDRLKRKGPSGRESFFFISTTRTYVLKEALPFLGKYNGTTFSKEYIVDLSTQVVTPVEKMNILDSHTKERGNSLEFETREKIVHCNTFAFAQLCQLYFASLQDSETALKFFQQPMQFLVATLESLFVYEKRKFACLLLVVLSKGDFNTTHLENNKNTEDDTKAKVQLALTFGEVKDPLPSLTEMGQDLRFMVGSFISMDGDWASFVHPTISDAVAFIVGERNSEFLLKHSSLKFIYDRVRINRHLPNGTLTRPTEGDRTNFLIFLAPTHYRALAKRFTKEVGSGTFSLVCAHEACSHPEFVEIFFQHMKDKGLVSRPASNLSARLHGKSSIHSSEKEHSGKFLYWTVWNRSHELTKYLLQKCVFTRKEKSQAMIGCSLSGNVKALTLLLEDIDADGVTYEPGSTMPHLGSPPSDVRESYIQQILVLGSTPLHIAAERGQLGIVKLLLSKGANVNKTGPRVAATPIHYACQGGHTDVVAHLLQGGANVNSLDWVQRTPLHWAASKGHSETVKFLTFNRCYLDAPDTEGLTPLHCAAWGGHLETCVSLLNAGASPKARTCYNKTPLDISIDESFKKKFHDTIVFDFEVFVDDTGVAAWLVGLRGPLILSVSATSMMVKRPRNHEVLFEWSLRTLRRFGHSYTSFKFEAGRNCETGEGVYNFVSKDAEDIMECVKMRLLLLEENNEMLFHRRAPPLH